MTTQTPIKRKNESTAKQMIKYTFVGGSASVIDIGTLYFLTEKVNLHYTISAAISFTLGLITNYVMSIFWVFTKRSTNSKIIEFISFTLIGIAGLALNELIMVFFTEVLFLYYLASKIISSIVVYFWNFFVRKLLLFN